MSIYYSHFNKKKYFIAELLSINTPFFENFVLFF